MAAQFHELSSSLFAFFPALAHHLGSLKDRGNGACHMHEQEQTKCPRLCCNMRNSAEISDTKSSNSNLITPQDLCHVAQECVTSLTT